MNTLCQQSQVDHQMEAAYAQIQSLINSGKHPEAIVELEEFIKVYPDFALAHNDLGVLHYQTGDKLRSLAHYAKAVRLAPDNITFRKNLVEFTFVELGWTDDAIFTYLSILEKHPQDIETLSALGTISNIIGQPDAARDFFRRVLDLEPWNAAAREALSALDAALAPSPSYCAPVSAPPQTEATPGNQGFDDILNSLRASIADLQAPMSPDKMYENAVTLANSGKSCEAISELEKLLVAFPDYHLAHNDLGVLYYQQGDSDKSLLHHETAVRMQPDNNTYQKNLANLYFVEFGRTDDAVAIFTGLLRKNLQDVETLLSLAQICIALGRGEDASIFVTKAIEIEPDNNDARNLAQELDRQCNSNFFLNIPTP